MTNFWKRIFWKERYLFWKWKDHFFVVSLAKFRMAKSILEMKESAWYETVGLIRKIKIWKIYFKFLILSL